MSNQSASERVAAAQRELKLAQKELKAMQTFTMLNEKEHFCSNDYNRRGISTGDFEWMTCFSYSKVGEKVFLRSTPRGGNNYWYRYMGEGWRYGTKGSVFMRWEDWEPEIKPNQVWIPRKMGAEKSINTDHVDRWWGESLIEVGATWNDCYRFVKELDYHGVRGVLFEKPNRPACPCEIGQYAKTICNCNTLSLVTTVRWNTTTEKWQFTVGRSPYVDYDWMNCDGWEFGKFVKNQEKK